jgi:hypothetical protein
MSARKEEKSPEQSRKPYRKPKLVDHGDLASVTKAKGGHASDGSGKPATKAPTGPGA